jgi:hypothetical protein
MRNAISLAVILLAFGLAGSAYGQNSRPIEDFVDPQGTFCFPDGMGGCMLFVPPLENFLGQSDPSNTLVSSVDYAGIGAAWIEDNCPASSLGTSFSGSVTERELADGRAMVHVVLHTDNALSWLTEGGFYPNPLLFGARAPDVCEGANPSLGSITMIIDLINTAPGDPLPDLLQVLVAPLEGQELPRLSLSASGDGELRAEYGVADGSRGRFHTTQVGLFAVPGMGAVADGFPVEKVSLKQVGRRND